MVDWCAVYQGVVDMGDFTLDRPVFKVFQLIVEPNSQVTSSFDIWIYYNIFASRRVFATGREVVGRVLRTTVAGADMPNNALKVAWATIATEYGITQASFNYFPTPAAPPLPV